MCISPWPMKLWEFDRTATKGRKHKWYCRLTSEYCFLTWHKQLQASKLEKGFFLYIWYYYFLTFWKILLMSVPGQRVSKGPLLRCHGVQECILLVTQRISKYPVLIQRILDNTAGESSLSKLFCYNYNYFYITIRLHCRMKLLAWHQIDSVRTSSL